ncbi:MAG TPA: YetF domain-containing protein [Acidimicrobiales bacterium]
MDIIVRAAVIYVFIWLVLRALGKRELGELTAFELVLLFIIGDLVQQSITADDKSLTAAVLAISVISLLIVVQSYAVFKWRRTRPVLEGSPVMLIYNGQVIDGPLQRERMTIEDLEEAAREHGIEHLSDVRAAVLETGGKLSFITSEAQSSPDDRHAA